MQKIFSVIIPVYNSKEYLFQAVESVLSQNLEAIEIILVDDGSTDGSSRICDALGEKHPNIFVIHQSNGGLSAARNAGLSVASGIYIVFLDSDDFLKDDNALSRIWQMSCGGIMDVVCYNYARFFNGKAGKAKIYPKRDVMNKTDLVNQNIYQSSACFKSVRRALIEDFRLRFPVGLLSEDIFWSANLLRCTDRIVFCDDVLYMYRVTPNSITQTIGEKNILSLLEIIECLTAKDVPVLDAPFYHFMAFQYCTLLVNWRLANSPVKQRIVSRIRQLSILLEYDGNPVVRLVKYAYRCFGMRGASRLLWFYFLVFRSK